MPFTNYVLSPIPRAGYTRLIVLSLLINCTFTAKAEITTAPKVAFDAEKAYQHLVKQTAFGPRLPGSKALQETRNLILTTLKGSGFKTSSQTFSSRSPLLGQVLEGQNLYGVYPPGSKVKYLVSAHYDSRPFADQDPVAEHRKSPVPGANDAASGVAILLELARVLPLNETSTGVALVFYDLEDHGVGGESSGFCLGSQHMAANLPPELLFHFGINLDMVGDADLVLKMEGYSFLRCGRFTQDFWKLGATLYPTVFALEKGPSVFDDHMPFLQRGNQYIDVIDFAYPPWHTTEDTADKCSPESLGAVGDTTLRFILN